MARTHDPEELRRKNEQSDQFEKEEVAEPEFLDALRDAVAAMEDGDVPYVVIGGLPSHVLGRPRETQDIDFLVKPEDSESALEVLAKAGFETQHAHEDWLDKAKRGKVLVDVIFRVKGEIYLDEDMTARARDDEYKGQRMKLVPPEDLIVMKAVNYDEEQPHHWYDALALLARDDLDWEYLVRRARVSARRVLSLLVYAESEDLVVPAHATRSLFNLVYGG